MTFPFTPGLEPDLPNRADDRITPNIRGIIRIDTAIVRTLYDEAKQQTEDATKYREYYDGEQPLVFGTDKFKEFFPAFEGLRDNWCGPVIDAMTDKMKLIGIALDSNSEEESNPLAQEIWDIFRTNNIDEQESELAEGVFVEGRAAVIVWPDEEKRVRIDWQPSSLVFVRYDEDDYRKVRIGVKRWVTASGQIRVNVYDSDELRKYVEGSDQGPNTDRAPGVIGTIPKKSPTLTLTPRFVDGEEWPLPHNFRVPPVVEFPNKRGSELSDVIPLQDSVNYLLMSSFIAGEFHALKQRVLFTHLAAPEGGWSSVPGRVWHVPPAVDSDGKMIHGQMGEFSSSELGAYRQLIEMVLQHLALTSKTPVRMFFKSDRGGRGDAPSGESELIEDEPLLDKVGDRETRLGNRWFQVAQLVARGIDKELPLGEMIWEDPRSKYRTALLDEAIKYVASPEAGKGLGLPIEWAIKRLGLSPEDLIELEAMLEQMKKDLEAEAEKVLAQERETAKMELEARGSQMPEGGSSDRPPSGRGASSAS